jgi:BASS family bile acid:Na+ symporter
MEFTGAPFTAIIFVFVASTMVAVGLGTTGRMVRRILTDARLLGGALLVNLILVPALGWGLAEVVAFEGPLFIALVLAASSPGGPFGAKLAMLQRGDALAGAALMVILAVIGSVTVPLTVAVVLSTAQMGAAGGISIAVGPLVARVALSQIVPFAIGVAARAWWGERSGSWRSVAIWISNVTFVVVLAWVLVFGFDDVLGLPATFVLAAAALIAGAVVLGTVLAPGPWAVKTAAGAVAGIRNAAPILAVIAVAFADRPGVLPAVAALVVVELALQVPWNLWLARRRAKLGPRGLAQARHHSKTA